MTTQSNELDIVTFKDISEKHIPQTGYVYSLDLVLSKVGGGRGARLLVFYTPHGI